MSGCTSKYKTTMKFQEFIDNIIKYKTINRLIIISLLIAVFLDFFFTDEYYLYFYIIPFLLTILKLLKIYTFKKRSLAYFRTKRSLKSIFLNIIFIIAMVLLVVFHPKLLDIRGSVSPIAPLILLLPVYFFPVFLSSIITYKNGIHIYVWMDDMIPWEKVDNVDISGEYVTIKISGQLKKYKYHKKDIEDVYVLVNQFSEYNEKNA